MSRVRRLGSGEAAVQAAAGLSNATPVLLPAIGSYPMGGSATEIGPFVLVGATGWVCPHFSRSSCRLRRPQRGGKRQAETCGSRVADLLGSTTAARSG